MSIEIQLFFSLRLFYSNSIDDILLRSILDTYETHSKLDIFTFDHSFGGGTFVHNIYFSYNTNCSNTFWVDLSGHLKTIGGSHIDVSWKSTKDDGSGIRNISVGH